MAVTTNHPGFEVSIEVDGVPLPEYDDTQPEAVAPSAPTPCSSVVKYIEAPSDTEFKIRWLHRQPFSPSFTVQPDVHLDGKIILIPETDYSPKDEGESYVCGGGKFFADEKAYTRKFRFSDLTIEENDQPISEEIRRQLLECGQIKIDFFFVDSMDQIAQSEVPPLDFEEFGKLSEKAVQKFSAEVGDAPTQSAGLSALEERVGGHLNELRTIGDGPFASFVFKYRSLKALKDLRVIPRTPTPTPPRSPTPLYDRDPESLNEEERLEQNRQLQQRLRDLEARVKREREDSTETAAADWSDEVQWTKSQPSERAQKKIRALPTAFDEVIELED